MRAARRWVIALAVTALAVAVVTMPLPLFVQRPNEPATFRGCVEGRGANPGISGDYLLMTITLLPASTLDAVIAGVQGDAAVVDRSDIIPPGTADEAYFSEQARVFASTSDVATVVGMRAAGLDARFDSGGGAVLPFPVAVDGGRVGGPSAGLAIALTVFDHVADVDLAAGRRIAVTGTLGEAGAVGPVGGIALKTIAAERVGADVFLVPAVQLEEARSTLTPSSPMKIVSASTFGEARGYLERSAPRAAGTDRAHPAVQRACDLD